MKNQWMSRGMTIMAAGAALLTVQFSSAQVNRPNQSRGSLQARRQAPKNYLEDLKAIGVSLGRRYQVRVVVDPALFVATKPTAPGEDVELAKSLDALAAGIKNASWRRVYLTQAQAAGPIAPDKLASAVRALELVEHNGLVLENPATKKATTYLKNFSVPADFNDALTAQQFDTRGIYVLYNSNLYADSSRTLEDQFFDLQKAQMDLMVQMDPEALGQAMARGMDLWNNMDPQMRGQMMGTMMKAGMQMWQKMPAEQQQQLMQSMMQNVQGLLGNGGPGRP